MLVRTDGEQRRDDHGQREPGDLAARRQAAGTGAQPAPAAHVLVRDDVHVDGAGVADGPRPMPGPVSTARSHERRLRAEHELRRVLRAGEGEQRLGMSSPITWW